MFLKNSAILSVCLFGVSSGFPAVGQSRYLPLEPGRHWDLTASNGQRMGFHVVDRRDGAYLVRWDNPWVKADFTFQPSGERILLNALDMGQGSSRFPSDTVYFDFGARQGARWSNALGTLMVTARGVDVNTPAGRFHDCIEIRATDKKNFNTFFTFAPNVGFVRFGEGEGAFHLTRMPDASPAETAPAHASTARAERQGTASSNASVTPRGRVLVGLDANPTPGDGFSEVARSRSFERAVQAGMTYTSFLPKWVELEPSPGKYNFGEVTFRTSMAERYDLPISLNVRVVDGGSKAMPGQYARMRFDDPKLAERLIAVLREMAPHFRGRVRWIAIGNEIDHYFGAHRNEIDAYARLIERVLPAVRQSFPGALFTVNFSNQSTGDLQGRYRPITSQVDFYSFNYYPLNGDFTMRDPDVAQRELMGMMNASAGRRVMFQEIGYSSGEKVNGSEERQAKFLANAFRTISEAGDRVMAMTVNWMSDLPDSVVNQLGDAYKLPNSDQFKTFLGTLGLFDKNGRPKHAWTVFQREAANLR